MICLNELTKNLNPEQKQSVTHPPEIPLQILAGPGSGKTKVLTSRIAYLILNHSIPATSICAVTFTNKAANEMKERLKLIIGKHQTSQLKMGTFHALCARFLRRYGELVGIAQNFTVCDADESKKILKGFLKEKDYQEAISALGVTVTDQNLSSFISKAKAKGKSAKDCIDEYSRPGVITMDPVAQLNPIFAEIYQEYDRTLRKNNSLDFDDLLVLGVKLFKGHRKTVDWCQHILVDEFQDTNIMQYQLMVAIASVHKCVTIVGDPDQSIYGWRSAEVENLAKMKNDFSNVRQIFLEQNYRSTSSILDASMAIISQDKSRIVKTLRTTHSAGVTPALVEVENEKDEAALIASEIKRVVAYMGGALTYGDFVILMRFNALSRAFESTLQKEGIPCRVLKGHKFFERLEVKDLIAYLQLVDNPAYDPAFKRAVNMPARGVGEKTLKQIEQRARERQTSQFKVVEQICKSAIPDIKPPIKKRLAPFVKIIGTLQALVTQDTSTPALIQKLLDLVDYHHHLRSTQPDWDIRWENVQELITFASEVEASAQNESSQGRDGGSQASEVENESDGITPLRSFLQASTLSSDGDNDEEGGPKEKVTLSTCHAAKGLEWPVVFVPSVEGGTFPFARNEDIEEERRLLYVACTRAQALLYLTHVRKRKIAAETVDRHLSEFVAKVSSKNSSIFGTSIPGFLELRRAELCKILGREVPDPTEAARLVAKHPQSRKPTSEGPPLGNTGWKAAPTVEIWRPTPNVPETVGFASSRLVHQNAVASSSQIEVTSAALGRGSSKPRSTAKQYPAPKRCPSPINIGCTMTQSTLSSWSSSTPRAAVLEASSQPSSSRTTPVLSSRRPDVNGRPNFPAGGRLKHAVSTSQTSSSPNLITSYTQTSIQASENRTIPPAQSGHTAPSAFSSPQHVSATSHDPRFSRTLGNPAARAPTRPQPLATRQPQVIDLTADDGAEELGVVKRGHEPTTNVVIPQKRRLGMGSRASGYSNKKFVAQQP